MPAGLIVFSGLDGAGKSTQLDLLADRLRREHISYIQVWSRGGYTPGMEWLKRITRRFSGHRIIPTAGQSPRRSRQFSRPAIRRIWLVLSILDLFWVYVVRMRLQFWMRRCVLADRYWQDTLLDYQLNFQQENIDRWWLWRLLVRMSPKPDVAILLTIPVEESIRRSVLKQEPFPTPTDQLVERARQYDRWAKDDSRWTWFDGRQEVADIAESIWLRVRTAIGSPQDPATLPSSLIPADSTQYRQHDP